MRRAVFALLLVFAASRPALAADRREVAIVSPSSAPARAVDGPPPAAEDAPGDSGAQGPFERYRFGELDTLQVGFYVGSGVGWLRDRTAAQGLGQVGATMHLGLAADLFDLLTASLTFGTVFVSDNGGFSEMVVDQFGNSSSAQSTLNLDILALTVGLRTPEFVLVGNPARRSRIGLHAYVRAGEAWITGSRSVDNCTNCTDQALSLDGGPVLETGVGFELKKLGGIGLGAFLGYRTYFGDASVAGEVQLGLGLSYF